MRCIARLLNVVGMEFGRLLPRAVVMVVMAALTEVMVATAALTRVMVAIAARFDVVVGKKRRLLSYLALLVLCAHANQLVSLLPGARVRRSPSLAPLNQAVSHSAHPWHSRHSRRPRDSLLVLWEL